MEKLQLPTSFHSNQARIKLSTGQCVKEVLCDIVMKDRLGFGGNLSRMKMGMNPKTKTGKMEDVDWGFLRNGRKSRHLEEIPR